MKTYFMENKASTIWIFFISLLYGIMFEKYGFIGMCIQIKNIFIDLINTHEYNSFLNGFFTSIGASFAFLLLIYIFYLMEKSLIEIHIKLVPDMIKDCDNSIEKVKDLTKDIEDSKAIIDQMKLQSTNEELQTQCSLIAEYIEKINKAKGEAADAFLEEKKSLEKDLRDYKTTSFVFTIYEFFGKKHFGGTEYNKFHDNLAFHLEKSEKAVQEMEKMVRAVGSIIKIIRSSAGRGL